MCVCGGGGGAVYNSVCVRERELCITVGVRELCICVCDKELCISV